MLTYPFAAYQMEHHMDNVDYDLSKPGRNGAANHDIGLSEVHVNPLSDSHDHVSDLGANKLSKQDEANAIANGTNGHAVTAVNVYDIKL